MAVNAMDDLDPWTAKAAKEAAARARRSNGGDDEEDARGWANPAPAAPWPELDPAAHYGIVGDLVDTISPHSEADPVALLTQFLVMVGNALGRGPFYRVEGDRHYLNLYAVLVGDTAKGRKGTAAGRVRQVMEAADSDWTHQRIQSGLASGEGLIWKVRDPIEEPVKTGQGANVQYIQTITDPGVSDKRLLIIESEFARPLAAVRRDGNTLSAVLRDGWDRGHLQIMTKNSPARASNAHVSLICHITTDELRRELDRVSMINGFANRFLFVCVKRSRELPFGGTLDPLLMLELAERTHRVMEAARQRQRISFSTTGGELWAAGYHDLSAAQPGLLGAVTARAEAQVVRLASLYAVLDQSPAIEVTHLQAALALWRYCAASASYVFGDALGDPIADEILRALRACSPDGMTRTELYNLFGRNQSSDRIGAALSLLLRHGKARRKKRDNGVGRPSEIWIAV